MEVIRFLTNAKGIEVQGSHPGGLGCPNVILHAVSHVDDFDRIQSKRRKRKIEDSRIGLCDSNHSRIDDRSDWHAGSRSYLADRATRKPLLDRTVRVAHDSQLQIGLVECLQSDGRATEYTSPQFE